MECRIYNRNSFVTIVNVRLAHNVLHIAFTAVTSNLTHFTNAINKFFAASTTWTHIFCCHFLFLKKSTRTDAAFRSKFVSSVGIFTAGGAGNATGIILVLIFANLAQCTNSSNTCELFSWCTKTTLLCGVPGSFGIQTTTSFDLVLARTLYATFL